MLFLTALAMASAQSPQAAKSVDCRPMLALMMSYEQQNAEAPREAPKPRADPRPRPQRRCITLASA